MRVCEFDWVGGPDLVIKHGALPARCDLVLHFGSTDVLAQGHCQRQLVEHFPGARVVGCSTGGHFDRTDIGDDRSFGIAISFGRARCSVETAPVSLAQSRACGEKLARALKRPDLKAVLVISDGLDVNGSDLVSGLSDILGPDVVLSGGLAGDGDRFGQTIVAVDGMIASGMAVAIGLYGDISATTGSAGGWAPFGARRRITRSDGNILHELDGVPALDLYEHYLGEEAQALPASALLFPLRIEDPANPGRDVVRTVLGIDRTARTMTFAGDMPEGWSAQLMRGSNDRLVRGAVEAMAQATGEDALAADRPGEALCLMISCIGRRLLMGQRAIDEVDAACEDLPSRVRVAGFYSYGEIAPHASSGFCELHNQTMTVLVLDEGRAAA